MKVFLNIVIILILIAGTVYAFMPHIINQMMPSEVRPGKIEFESSKVSAEDFEAISMSLKDEYSHQFDHIKYYKEEGLLEYSGPQTCLKCHQEITIKDAISGEEYKTDLMQNLTTSVHYRFYSKKHPNVYGFNGELADNFAMGKINRPCPKPGSFAMTSWASFVITESGDTLSEGCGQCHIGGQYAAPLGEMMPGYRTLQAEKDAIDCLICHAAAYDMNRKQVVADDNGRTRWDQDRSMKAAMSVITPDAPACLRCHQHNMGGDIYVSQKYPEYHQSLINTGYDRPRVLHPGSKRGTPYNPEWDVHAAAGMSCIDCHTTEGHYIAKGTHTTTMMANDLPEVEIRCQSCHEDEPHAGNPEHADFLNNHSEFIACQTCHIPSLHPDNATRRDFKTTHYEESENIYIYTDVVKKHQAGDGIVYKWWNGDASFLGNPIGDNPNGENLYRFYDPEHVWPEFADFDYKGWYDSVMRPIAQNGRPSKIYAMKLFNGRQHIDLQNIGPFGGMFLPYNLPLYYRNGDPDKAAAEEMRNPMMKRMYGWMFKYYMLDRFMSYMDIDGWNTGAYKDASNIVNVEARWLPQNASLEISHAIRLDGALTCNNCHAPDGVIDFRSLGYSAKRAEELQQEIY